MRKERRDINWQIRERKKDRKETEKAERTRRENYICIFVGVSNDSKMKLIKEAVTWHSKLVREAATGNLILIYSFPYWYIYSHLFRSRF